MLGLCASLHLCTFARHAGNVTQMQLQLPYMRFPRSLKTQRYLWMLIRKIRSGTSKMRCKNLHFDQCIALKHGCAGRTIFQQGGARMKMEMNSWTHMKSFSQAECKWKAFHKLNTNEKLFNSFLFYNESCGHSEKGYIWNLWIYINAPRV